MDFQFLPGFFESIEQVLCQILHQGTAQFVVRQHEISKVRLFNHQQFAVFKASRRKTVYIGFKQTGCSGTISGISQNGDGKFKIVIHQIVINPCQQFNRPLFQDKHFFSLLPFVHEELSFLSPHLFCDL